MLFPFFRELEAKNQHLLNSNSSLKKEATESKAALTEHQTEHQKCMASFAEKCTSYEREIGQCLMLGVCVCVCVCA